MADKKATVNGWVTLWVAPVSTIADLNKITPEEINKSVNITSATSWSDTTYPTAEASEDVSDRSLADVGNASSRGKANYKAELTLFYPTDVKDQTSEYAKAWNVFKKTRERLVLIARVGQAKYNEPAKEGEWYSAFLLMNSTYKNNTEGDSSVKYMVKFLTQGQLRVNGLVKGADGATIEPTGTVSLGVGAHKRIHVKAYGGKRVTTACEFKSDHPEFATVSTAGVITGVKAGSATITATHPSIATELKVQVTVA